MYVDDGEESDFVDEYEFVSVVEVWDFMLGKYFFRKMKFRYCKIVDVFYNFESDVWEVIEFELEDGVVKYVKWWGCNFWGDMEDMFKK